MIIIDYWFNQHTGQRENLTTDHEPKQKYSYPVYKGLVNDDFNNKKEVSNE